MSNAFSMRVEAAPTFRRNLRKLRKKYRSIQADVQLVIDQLQQGEYLGDLIPGLEYEVFKLRVRNRDIAAFIMMRCSNSNERTSFLYQFQRLAQRLFRWYQLINDKTRGYPKSPSELTLRNGFILIDFNDFMP